MWEIIFILSLLAVCFAYFGYPLTLCALAMVCRRGVAKAPITPPVTLIVTVFNEEKRIREKLENALALEYPRENLQILVASDASANAPCISRSRFST